jgi:2-(1,2-epoxy-1,2-dihydrophenyl)acetyl-CoA isomerase
MEELLYEKQDGIATITLNRPERMNAFSPDMLQRWAEAIGDADHDDAVRVVIVTGAGRGFCAGMDVKDRASSDRDGRFDVVADRHHLRDSVHRVARAVARLEKPYLAAINGAAVGAGMDMASMADIRFAADTAKFGMSFIKVGIVPGDGGAYHLPRIVGRAKALELIWTGDLFDAEEALRIGYVSRVVPADRLMEEAQAFARRLADGPAVAIQLSKRLVDQSAAVDYDTALDLAESAMLIARSTEDAREGPRAFAEKRSPKFTGR